MSKLYKILKPFIWLLLLLATIIVTLPKANLYYKLEEYLKQKDVIVHDESVNSSLFGFSVDNGIINYKQIDGAYFKSLDITTALVYNKIDLTNLRVNKNLQRLIPTNIDSLQIKYTILNPIKVDIKGTTQLGYITGYINLYEKRAFVKLEPKRALNSSQKRLINFMKYEKISNKGVYTYEYSY
ncbi:MAG: hypothetical protein ACQERD_06970 [Campylobacterota bacterium]